MKSVICAVVIFILIITLSVVSAMYTDSCVDEMLHQLYKNEKNVAENQWEYAREGVEKVGDIWAERKTISSFFLNHSVIDSIDSSIERLINSVILREKSVFYYEKNEFELLMKKLKEQQKISLPNIF